MKKMVIYPYGNKAEPLVRHFNLLQEYELAGLISPNGWGLVGETIGINQRGKPVNLTIQADFSGLNESTDTVLIPDVEIDEKYENRLVDELIQQIPKIKEILCAFSLSAQSLKKIEEACTINNSVFTVINQSDFQSQPDKTQEDVEFYSINVPVITIMSQWNDMDKLEISLLLRDKFIRDGYSVSQVGSRAYAELFGFSAFPGFMTEPVIGEENKVIMFNHFIEKMSRIESPDVIIITIPGAMQNMNQEHLNGFGILPYLTTQAITTDILIASVFYNPGSVQYLAEMSNLCTYKVGAPIDCCHMTNMFIDMASTKEKKKVVINKVYRESVQETVEKNAKLSSVPLFNMYSEEEAEKAYQSILKKLSGIS